MSKPDLILVRGSSNPELASRIGQALHPPIRVYNGRDMAFPDGEFRVRMPMSEWDGSVYILQPTCPPDVNRSYMELLQMIDAARGIGARRVVAVTPYFGFARQNERKPPGTSNTAELMAHLIQAAGADKIITLDLHSEKTMKASGIPWLNLRATDAFVAELNQLNLSNPVVVCPDRSAYFRALYVAYGLGLGKEDITEIEKRRDMHTGKSEVVGISGSPVKGREAVVVDDIGSTFKTATDAARHLLREGSIGVHVAITHGIFMGGALSRIDRGPFETVLTTDSIPHRKAVLARPQIQILSVASILARTIEQDYHQYQS